MTHEKQTETQHSQTLEEVGSWNVLKVVTEIGITTKINESC